MRVFLCDRSNAGGIWNVLHPVAAALRDRGDDVTCVRWRDKPAAYEDAPDGVRVAQIDVPPRRRAADVLRQSAAFGRSFAGLLRRERPDAVHTNFVLPGAAARVAARAAGVPRVVLCRHELATSLNRPLRVLERTTGRLAAVRIHVSREVARSYGAAGAAVWDERPGVPPAGDVVVHNGVSATGPAVDTPREPGLVVCAGRLVDLKGQRVLLRAFADVAGRRPAARLRLIGRGPDEAGLRALADELGVAARVDFAGWVPHEEVLRQFAAADAVAVPGGREGFGLTLAEACACGGRVVAADAPAFREILGPGGTGWFPLGDAPALGAELLRLLDDPAADATQTAARRSRVLGAFTVDRCVAGHLAALDGTAGRAAVATTSTPAGAAG